MGGPPDRWWPRWCRFNSFQFRARSVGNHFRYMKPSLAPHEKTKRTKFGKGGWKISLPMMKSDFSLCPSHACMCMYVCMHASMLSVCLSIFLSIHLCISALVHSSIPCKTEIFARQKVMGRVRSFFQAAFFTRICQFLGCNGEVWTFFGPPQKKNLQSYPVDFNTSQNLSENPQAEFCQDAHQMPISSCLNAQQPPITFGRPYQ